MRLVDADAIFSNELLLVRAECYDAVHAVIEKINNAPTVDAVEVVRCKDCKWWTKQSDSPQGRCELFHHYPTGGWYCANGRRKNEAG